MGRVRAAAALAAVLAVAACGAASSGAGVHSAPVDSGPSTTLTFAVQPLHGGSSAPPYDAVVAVLRHRLQAAGIDRVRVSKQGPDVVVSAPSSERDRVTALATEVGRLRFRQVLEAADIAASKPQHVGPSEAPTLSRDLRASFAAWDCASDPVPTGGDDRSTDVIIACDRGDRQKLLLGPAKVDGSQVKDAYAGLGVNVTGWQVDVEFTRSGARAFLSLTRTAYDATRSASSGFGTCTPPRGCNAVAIALDGVVESAPAIQSEGGIPGGIAEITGGFDEASATTLADVLKSGSLPARLTVVKPRA